MRKTALIVGDSHVRYFCEKLPAYDVITEAFSNWEYQIDVMKCGTTGSTIRGLKNINSNTKMRKTVLEFIEKENVENIFFSIGDVDCRTHLKTMDDLDKTVEIYKEFLNEVKKNISNVFVMDLVPYCLEGIAAHNDIFEEALDWNLILSERLRNLAEDEGHGFFSVRDKFVDLKGLLKLELRQKDDWFHLEVNQVRGLYLRTLKGLL